MKPYLGILIDSFWEAVGNKVLWAQLFGWTFILASLAPFGYVSERSFELSSVDIANRDRLVEKLGKAIQGRGPESIQRIASFLEPEFAGRILKYEKTKDDPDLARRNRLRESELAKGLNAAVTAPDLYTPEAFPTAHRRQRLEPLIAIPADKRSRADVEELNRQLLQLAFPTELNRPRGEQLWIGYAGFKLGEPLPITRRQIDQFVQPIVLQVIIKFGLAILAVFIAIIVTSPMIPETFRSGSLHLLLSKPISRVWLFLTKFFGGTIFVLVTITYVMLGLYAIAGLRFGIWNDGLLYCIPVLLFVFVIFYSISALVGMAWGNAIVSVVACGLFWFTCLVLGIVHDSMQPHVELLPRIARIEPIGEQPVVVNERGEFNVWNDEFQVWRPAANLEGNGQVRTFGPIYLPDRQQILVKSFIRVPFGGLVARSRKLAVIDLRAEDGSTTADEASITPVAERAHRGPEEPQAQADSAAERAIPGLPEPPTDSHQPHSLEEAREQPLWSVDLGPELPQQMFDLLDVGGDVIAVCRGGIFRLNMELLDAAQATEQQLFGIRLPWVNKTAFENIAPPDYFPSENTSAAPLHDGSGIVVYSSGNIDILRKSGPDSKLVLEKSTHLEGEGTEIALVHSNRSYTVVARKEMPIAVLDADLNLMHEIELENGVDVKQLSYIPGGEEFAVVTHAGKLLRLDPRAGTLTPIPVGDRRFQVTCVRWLDAHRAYIGVRPDRVYQVDTATNRILASYEPVPRLIDRIYRWGVSPIYAAMPKPAALDNVMMWLLTDSNTVSLGINDLQQAQQELDVWEPLVSNTLFVALILGFSSWYVARKEF
ncbi:MAG: ABC transporter permease [Planctomycetota bacterium]|nr:MAG: ABC transporter permease [Planctomycetota bacterium]